jgi:hypothetical protein
MTDIPNNILGLVKDNVIVQWCLVVSVIMIIGTNTATKLKGPVGTVARWVQNWGDKRAEREATERRERRQKLLSESREHREDVRREIADLTRKIEQLYDDRDALERLIRQHLGWDYDRVQQLIGMGVRTGDIPTPPAMRLTLSKRTDTQETPVVRAGPSTDETVIQATD